MTNQTATPREGGFFQSAVRRPVTLFVLFTTLIVIGVIAYSRIPLEMIPDGMQGNGLEILVENPGASAEENESKVARVLEEQIRTLSMVDDVFSYSNEDRVNIEITYERDSDMDLARAELRDRIERARPALPPEIDRIFVWDWGSGGPPLMFFAVLHEGTSERNDYLVETVVQRRLEAVDGVSRSEIWGMLDDSVRILLDEDAVRASQLDIGNVIQRLQQDNFTEPLGEVYDGGRKVLLRSDMRFGSLEEIERFPVGGGLVLNDLGRVAKVKSVRNRMARIDGKYAYWGWAGQESTANVVETARRMKAELERMEEDPSLEGRFTFLILFNQGSFIEASLNQLRDTALWGGALAALILFLFLRRVRLTICVALSIPVSALLALTWEYFLGGTFNVLTMTGITLAIGMLVDNSVVVIENISRLHAEGASPRQAAARGARDVGLAVSLATLTTVVVFLPLIFMAGNPAMRVVFGSIGLPLCFSLLFSLMVALVFLPVVTARIVGPRAAWVESAARRLAPIASFPARVVSRILNAARALAFLVLGFVHRLERLALRALTPLRLLVAAGLVGLYLLRTNGARSAAELVAPLSASGAAPGTVESQGTVATMALIVGLGLVLFGPTRWRRRPADAPRPAGAAPVAANSLVDILIASNSLALGWALKHRLFASALAAMAFFSIAIPSGSMTMAAFGEDETRTRIDVRVQLEDNFTLGQASEEMEIYERAVESVKDELGFEHVACQFWRLGGRVSLYWDQAMSPEEMASARELLREVIPKIAGHRVRYYDEERIDTRNRSIATFQLQGPDHQVLSQLGEQALARLEKIPGLYGVGTELQNAPERVQVKLDPEQAWQQGVSAQAALQNIAWALRGAPLSRYHEPGREIPFYIEYDSDRVVGLDTLRELEVFTQEGIVPLASFARLDFQPGPRSIFRRNGQASFAITGRVDDPNRQKEISEAGYASLREMDLPRGYSVGEQDRGGNSGEAEIAEMKKALLLSVVLVFLLMGILFESVLLPFSVLFTIPFAIAGAVWTLFLTGTAMDSVGWIGLIILVGVVVNNGIVLIDRIHRLRGEGRDRTEAVIEGGRSRVRPIVMTAMTTIFGLLPMSLSEPPAEGIDYRALATCVAGGLAFSTFFTLWVVPLAYTIFDDLDRVLRQRGAWLAARFRGRARAARAGAAPSPEAAS